MKRPRVSVYPVGHPDLAQPGEVVILSENKRSIAVCFKDKPGFISFKTGAYLSVDGVMLLATRSEHELTWHDITDNALYRITLPEE